MRGREQKRVEKRERKEGREKERYDINRDEREEKEKALGDKRSRSRREGMKDARQDE